MLEDMQLRGLSARTQEAYTRAVWQLAAYYHRSPVQLSDEELRRYFFYLANEKKLAPREISFPRRTFRLPKKSRRLVILFPFVVMIFILPPHNEIKDYEESDTNRKQQ
jgi:hypothetical protein